MTSHVIGLAADGISKEQKYMQQNLVAYIAAPAAHRDDMKVFLSVLDCKHQVKSGRNAPGFGGTVCPFGGSLVVAINAFTGVDAPWRMLFLLCKLCDKRTYTHMPPSPPTFGLVCIVWHHGSS